MGNFFDPCLSLWWQGICCTATPLLAYEEGLDFGCGGMVNLGSKQVKSRPTQTSFQRSHIASSWTGFPHGVFPFAFPVSFLARLAQRTCAIAA